ncbi:hypothetical protein D9757_007657 [Collybiopsis confluens]|uniref:Uncharacterized protein n=1 Tax=Collybiopsis confluens TaxID=2823264 RepID=A0A8H5M3I6_9AGAR|nr:hypothetical protein D9757_007657 [Collybiopsis confluens]
MSASQIYLLVIPVACETLVYGRDFLPSCPLLQPLNDKNTRRNISLSSSDVHDNAFVSVPLPPSYEMRGLRGSTARQVLFCVVLAMFLSSTGTLVSDIMARLRLGPASIQVLNSESDIAQVIFIRINFLLSDYVVIWRCWNLWDSVLSVRLLLAFCVMVSTGVVRVDDSDTILRSILKSILNPESSPESPAHSDHPRSR